MIFERREGLPAVSGSSSCPRLQAPDDRLNRTACTDGEDRFGAKTPRLVQSSVTRRGAGRVSGGRTGGASSCPGSRDGFDHVTPWVGRQVATGGSRVERGPPT